MKHTQLLEKVEQNLFWLDANARHAIECQETFAFPFNSAPIRQLIKETKKVRCFNICLNAIYVDLVITLMRMYDSYERDTACFENLFACLTDDFIQNLEIHMRRTVTNTIERARNEFASLKGSHLMGRLNTVRHNMLAHTSTNFNRNQVARYGDAEKLLERTLQMLNQLNSSIRGKVESYDRLHKYWKGYAVEFWQAILDKND